MSPLSENTILHCCLMSEQCFLIYFSAYFISKSGCQREYNSSPHYSIFAWSRPLVSFWFYHPLVGPLTRWFFQCRFCPLPMCDSDFISCHVASSVYIGNGNSIIILFLAITMDNSLSPLIYVAYKLLYQPLLPFTIDFCYKHITPKLPTCLKILLCS